MTPHWLELEGVRLQALRPDDLATLLPWFQDGAFLRSLDAEAALPRSPEAVREAWLAATPNAFRFGVAAEEGLVGLAALDGILWNQRIGWCTLLIGPPHQQRGYGRRAFQLLLAVAFRELNLRKLQLTVFADNAHAIRLYEAAGFHREGCYREFVERDGRVTDMWLCGLLRREWEHDTGATAAYP